MKFLKGLQRLLRESQASPQAIANYRQISDAILDRIGEKTTPKTFLGEGNFAEVYWLNSQRKKALKITTDPLDAYALQRVHNKPQRHLVKVYDVFEIVPRKLWGSVVEKLTSLSQSDKQDWDQFWNDLNSYLDSAINELNSFGLSPEFASELVDLIESEQEEGIISVEVPGDPILEALQNWGKELQALNIKIFDLHSGNVMMRRDNYILVDLGYGEVSATRIDKLLPNQDSSAEDEDEEWMTKGKGYYKRRSY